MDISKRALAERLALIKKETNSTFEELGDITDTSKQAASNWVRTGRISETSLFLICEHFAYNPSWLITGEGSKTVVQAEPPGITSEEAAMLDAFKKLSESERKAIKTVADSMAQQKQMKKAG